MIGYHIERLAGHRYAVVDSAGAHMTGPLSIEAAQKQIAALDAAERARRASDPKVLARRNDKTAYRLAERDPALRTMKRIFPRKGAAMRNTLRSNAHSLACVGRCMNTVSSDPTARAALNKSQGQRRTAKASQANAQRGAAMRAQVAERWHVLADLPERKRAARIAEELRLDVRHVRRLRPRSIPKNKKRTFRGDGRFPIPLSAIRGACLLMMEDRQ